MSMIDPQRYRALLVLSLDDAGLEELVLRLVLPDYPDAYRTGPGQDDGMDVISDLNPKLERAWQAKNFKTEEITWSECRTSLKSAMSVESPTSHYTFVFPRKLRKGERKFWTDKFVPEQKALYPQLETLDLCDDLATSLESRSDLVDQLNHGALASYLRATLADLHGTGASPLASGTELLNPKTKAATPTAAEIGRHDPNFTYVQTDREASEHEVPHDRRLSFTMRRDQQDNLPRYTMRLREGESVRELAAEPRPRAVITHPKPWFADSEGGEQARTHARVMLAKGQPVVLDGDEVGVEPGTMPDRFRSQVDENGLLRKGRLELGLSEPLELTVRMSFSGEEVVQPLTLYRVPELPGDSVSYAGAYHGAVLLLNSTTDRPSKEQNVWVDGGIEVTLFMDGEHAIKALRGLGFARAFGEADRVWFECPGLLPEGGIGSEGRTPPNPHADEVWRVATVLAAALAELEKRDGLPRPMPKAMGERQLALADTVLQLLSDGEIRAPFEGTLDAPLPADTDLQADPQSLLRFTAPLPELCGQPTLTVEQSIE
ncbi:MAG: hypothetical protein WAN93_03430, partial [Solirubrobacteraceae bacterium]